MPAQFVPWNSIAESVVEYGEQRLSYPAGLASPCLTCRTAPCCTHVRVQTFRKTRKYAYFVILVIAVFAAPSGDPLTLGVLFLPLIGLYELGIFVSAMVVKQEEEPEEPEQLGGC